MKCKDGDSLECPAEKGEGGWLTTHIDSGQTQHTWGKILLLLLLGKATGRRESMHGLCMFFIVRDGWGRRKKTRSNFAIPRGSLKRASHIFT